MERERPLLFSLARLDVSVPETKQHKNSQNMADSQPTSVPLHDLMGDVHTLLLRAQLLNLSR